MLGLQNEREWQQFCAVVLQQPGTGQRPALPAGNAQRSLNRDTLRALIVAGLFHADGRSRWRSGWTTRRLPTRR